MRAVRYCLAYAVCALALSMVGCAGAQIWVACELGRLPQTAQSVIPAVIQALDQGSESAALAALENIGASLAPGQLACIIQAIAADTMRSGRMGANRGAIEINAAAYRARHPERLSCDKL